MSETTALFLVFTAFGAVMGWHAHALWIWTPPDAEDNEHE